MAVAPRVVVVCAMASEARALVARWHLTERGTRPFRSYGDGRHRVIVSGVGALASATAVGFAAADGGAADLWFNLGIAGHGTLPLGTAVLADRVAHHDQARAWYPAQDTAYGGRRGPVLSHDAALTDYPPVACCDMEASGFMVAATRVTREDCVQVMKVVSDNAEFGIEHIARRRVEALMDAALPDFLELVAASAARAGSAPPPVPTDALAPLFERWHFSHARAAQLRLLWRRSPWSWQDAAAVADTCDSPDELLHRLCERAEGRFTSAIPRAGQVWEDPRCVCPSKEYR